MNKLVCIILTIVLVFAACSNDTHIQHQLQELDILVDHNPDSVLSILHGINADSLDQDNRMHLELLRAKAMNKAFVNFTTDSVMLQVVDYYDHHGTHNQQMLSHYLLGCTYRDMGSAPKTIESYLEATSKADTTDADCDFRTLMLIHSQLANVYGQLYAINDEEREINAAQKICTILCDTVSWNLFEDMKCGILLKEGKYRECIHNVNKNRQKYLKDNNIFDANKVSVFSAKAYIELGKYDSARYCLDNYSRIFDNELNYHAVVGGAESFSILLGRYYVEIGKPDSALLCFRQVNMSNIEPQQQVTVYKGLSDSYGLMSKPDSVNKYLSLYSSLMDQYYDKSIAESSIKLYQLYNYGVEQQIAKAKEAEAAFAKFLLMLMFIFIIVLIALVIFIKYRHILAQKKVIDITLAHEHTLEELRIEESRLYLLRSQKNELEELLSQTREENSQFCQELSKLNQAIHDKTNKIFDLSSQIDQLETLIEPNRSLDANKLFWHSEVVDYFRRVFTSKGYTIKEEDWDRLQSIVNKLFPNFWRVVDINGKLSKTDKRICILVKAKFNPSEIEYLLQMKHSYASNARKRLHQTIFGYPGSGEDFDKKILFIK